jgi:hypothetical protein
MDYLRQINNRGDMVEKAFPSSSVPGRLGNSVSGKILVALFVLSLAGSALAALSPPVFMPGFPLVAGKQIIFMWNPVMGAEKYRIYQDGKVVAESTAFQHILALPMEGKHSYHIVGVDKGGKEGPAGKTFEYSVRKLLPPKAVAVLIRDKKVAVRWDPAEGALVYDVLRGDAPDGKFQMIGSTQDITFLDPNVEFGKKYYYRVTAKDATGGSSAPSDPVLGLVEKEAEAPVAERLKIVKTKLEWEKKDIQNASDLLYLSDDSFVVVVPFSNLGPFVVIVEDTGSSKDKRIAVPLPEEQKEDRFGGLGRSGDGTVWVTGLLSPTAPTIYRVDPASKQIVEVLKVKELPKTETPYSFVDVAEAPNGDLYVTEQTNASVMVIRKGKIVSRFGTKGRDAGQFASPSTILIADDMVLVADSVQASINFFGLDGKFIRRVGSLGGHDPGTFSRLAGMAVDGEKKWLFVSDRATSQIQIFDFEGKFIAMISNEKGTGGPHTNPVSLDTRNDSLLVSWQTANRVQEFRLLGPPEER